MVFDDVEVAVADAFNFELNIANLEAQFNHIIQGEFFTSMFFRFRKNFLVIFNPTPTCFQTRFRIASTARYWRRSMPLSMENCPRVSFSHRPISIWTCDLIVSA